MLGKLVLSNTYTPELLLTLSLPFYGLPHKLRGSQLRASTILRSPFKPLTLTRCFLFQFLRQTDESKESDNETEPLLPDKVRESKVLPLPGARIENTEI